MNLPELSIVVGTRNRPDSFRRLVDSVEDYTAVDWELIVADASDIPIEDQPVATEEAWRRIVVLPERPRLGCTKGYNRAFRETRGKWVIWLNDDTTVTPGYAENAIGFMKKHLEIGLGALRYDEPGCLPQTNIAWDLPYANFGILRRVMGNRVDWFDEDFPMYGNDNSLTFRVLLAGYGIAEVPDVVIHHHPAEDDERKENFRYRRTATDILTRKYEQHLPAMREVYERTRLKEMTHR